MRRNKPRGARASDSSRPAHHGGINKHRDKDGNVNMGVTVGSGRGRGRGRARGRGHGRGRGAGLNGSATTQDALHKALADLDGEKTYGGRGGLAQLIVRGWDKSRLASSPGGGWREAVQFLERKASGLVAQGHEKIWVKEKLLDGDALIISVRPEDKDKFISLNGFRFAGATLEIELMVGNSTDTPKPNQTQTFTGHISDPADLVQKLTVSLNRRYTPTHKLLDLSNLGNDMDIVNTGMFNNVDTESKFFPALMKVVDKIFTSWEHKRQTLESVDLSNNALADVAAVTTLAQTLPDIKNLDLSNNVFKTLSDIEAWRWKFRSLEHLVLKGNPIELLVSNLNSIMKEWYPRLEYVSGIRVRSSEEAAASAKPRIPLQIQVLGSSFRDQAAVGENFVKFFFPSYDTNRSALATSFYDAESTFSYSVNKDMLRMLDAKDEPVQPWEIYTKRARNLDKIHNLLTRMDRLYNGPERIREVWLSLPTTQHPPLLEEAYKWCVECHALPGLPDPSGESPGGVGGLIVTIHGEFAEVDDLEIGTVISKRSFDRTFVLGPGSGLNGIRVVSDVLVLRAYQGYEAWKPRGGPITAPIQTVKQQRGDPPMPLGWGGILPGKSERRVEEEMVAYQLSKATGLTLEYSGLCLAQTDWNMAAAMFAFEKVKANLPSEAFY